MGKGLHNSDGERFGGGILSQTINIDGKDIVLMAYSQDQILHNDFTNSHLKWWAENTQGEKHMCSETVESLQDGLLGAIIALEEDSVVAAAGIFNARTKEREPIFFEEQLVVELGSNYVTPDYRSKGLGRVLLEKRIEFSQQNGWFPISVTTNPAMQSIFMKKGFISMDKDPLFSDLQKQLCLCPSVNPDCKLCPLAKNGGWVLKDIVKS